jgi:undecaprenyl-diphosphatase
MRLVRTWPQRWLLRIRRWRTPELRLLASLGLVVGAGWAAIEIADQVREGETQSFDEWILKAFRSPTDLSDPRGPLWVEEAWRDITALGGLPLLALLTAAAVGYLLLERKRRSAALVCVSVLGGLVLSLVLKNVFQRPRPDLVPHEMEAYSSSFPSGHSMMSAATFLTLASLLASVQHRRKVKVYLIASAIFLMLLVGASRVYLGVHWPSDVVAGWAIGIAWSVLCTVTMRWLKTRGTLAPDGEAPNGNKPRS